jgi:hypothetical protein
LKQNFRLSFQAAATQHPTDSSAHAASGTSQKARLNHSGIISFKKHSSTAEGFIELSIPKLLSAESTASLAPFLLRSIGSDSKVKLPSIESLPPSYSNPSSST